MRYEVLSIAASRVTAGLRAAGTFVRTNLQPPAPAGRVLAAVNGRYMSLPPVRRYPLTLAVPLAIMALWAGVHAFCLFNGSYIKAFAWANNESAGPFPDEAAPWVIVVLRAVSIAAAGFFLVSAAAAYFVRGPRVYKLLAAACIVAYAHLAVNFVTEAMLLSYRVMHEIEDIWWLGVFFMKLWRLLPPVLAVLAFMRLRKMLARSDVAEIYGVQVFHRQFANARVVKSLKGAFQIHLWLMFLLPWLLINPRGVSAYYVPGGGGGGGGGQQVVQTVKIKPQKKRRRMIVRANSAISFYVPNINDSKVQEEVDEITQQTYQATGAGEGGGKGFGKGPGSGGGWAGGSALGKVRFIRIQHNGPEWNDGMDVKTGRADMNFLEALRAVSGFKIAEQSEAHPMYLLRQYRKGTAPPFVFLTGRGPIEGISPAEYKILHDYCINEHGLLFADDAGGGFHQSFLELMRRAFPEFELCDIPNDDFIFRIPFTFPNGAPPIWHVAGDRLLGIRHNGRWAVIYFPGDIHDAWKTGHSGLSEHIAQQAFKVGFNIIYYAFTQYTEFQHPQAGP